MIKLDVARANLNHDVIKIFIAACEDAFLLFLDTKLDTCVLNVNPRTAC